MRRKRVSIFIWCWLFIFFCPLLISFERWLTLRQANRWSNVVEITDFLERIFPSVGAITNSDSDNLIVNSGSAMISSTGFRFNFLWLYFGKNRIWNLMAPVEDERVQQLNCSQYFMDWLFFLVNSVDLDDWHGSRLTNEHDVVLRVELWDFDDGYVYADYESFR